MTSQINNDYGSISYDDDVVAKIACSSAMETYGVVGLAAKSTIDGIYKLLGLNNMTRGVRVEAVGDNEIKIEISVILQYGTRIAVVAENVIDKVKYNVERATGLSVNSVDLIVQGIHA